MCVFKGLSWIDLKQVVFVSVCAAPGAVIYWRFFVKGVVVTSRGSPGLDLQRYLLVLEKKWLVSLAVRAAEEIPVSRSPCS